MSASTDMSTVSGSRLSTTTKAMLSTVMNRLDAMDDKLKALDPLCKKVTTLEASAEDLGAQQVTLIMVVERVDIMQTTLNAKINHIEVGQRVPPQDRQQAQGHERQADNDGDQGGDFLPTAHKLEFQKYDGTGDPLPWLNRCERYFFDHQTPEHKLVAFAAFYLLDYAQLWFHRMELNGGHPTWPQFMQLVNARFGPPLTDSPIGELAMLCCIGIINEFCKCFIALSCRDTSLIEAQQIQLSITGWATCCALTSRYSNLHFITGRCHHLRPGLRTTQCIT
jgi:hypothetical protein